MIRNGKIRILPPIGKQKRYPALTLTVIRAEERMAPKKQKENQVESDLPMAAARTLSRSSNGKP
ncbi:hypothetical protein ACVIHH_008498 [Bradyrhizobium sp. USDA 4518]